MRGARETGPGRALPSWQGSRCRDANHCKNERRDVFDCPVANATLLAGNYCQGKAATLPYQNPGRVMGCPGIVGDDQGPMSIGAGTVSVGQKTVKTLKNGV
jgi:hypothetical protein